MKYRLLRVRELLKRELSEAIQKELTFDGVLVTVNDVDVTPDLRQGHVFVGIVGDEAGRMKALDLLKKNRALLQRALCKRVVLKYMPQLHFKIDDSVARGVSVLSVIDELGELEGLDGDPLQSDPEEGMTEESDERI